MNSQSARHMTLLLLAALGMPSAVCAQPKASAPNRAPVPPPKSKPKEVPLAERLRSPQDIERPLADKRRSPRETLKTLYFAVTMYDLFPAMIGDAIACLDLEAMQPRPLPEDAAVLALDLEYVLQTLCMPLKSVPDQG